MSDHTTNGKSTAALALQVVMVIGAIAAPLVLMYAKINSLEVEYSERMEEVESQFRAADEFRNVNLANQMRLNSLLWKKAYDEDFPSETYYPAIAKHRK